MEKIENLLQTETGPRHVMQGTYQGTRFEVVAGYDIREDQWMYHVYVHQNQGRTDRLTETPTQHKANSLHEAFDLGMKLATGHLAPTENSAPREGEQQGNS